jgi:hypothetical protein
MEYICNVFNRSVESVAWEMNFDIICYCTEVFNMGVWGIDFQSGIAYK